MVQINIADVERAIEDRKYQKVEQEYIVRKQREIKMRNKQASKEQETVGKLGKRSMNHNTMPLKAKE